MLPDEVVAFGANFEEALATLIISIAPMAPHYASELWHGFISASGRVNESTSKIHWEKPVLEQPWPKVDGAFQLSCHIHVCYLWFFHDLQ